MGVGPDGARGPLAAVHAAAEVEEVFAGGGLVVVLRVAEEPGLLAGDEPLDGERARGALGEEEDVRAGGRPPRRGGAADEDRDGERAHVRVLARLAGEAGAAEGDRGGDGLAGREDVGGQDERAAGVVLGVAGRSRVRDPDRRAALVLRFDLDAARRERGEGEEKRGAREGVRFHAADYRRITAPASNPIARSGPEPKPLAPAPRVW